MATLTAAKYRRISDDRESEELGIARQDEDLDAFAASHKLSVVADFVDNDLSASTRSTKPRPGYDALIAAAKAGRFKVIMAYTSSRLTRRPRELEDLIELAERYGVRFLYLRSPSFDLNTADGRMIARQLAAADAAEAERTAERVARARRQRVESGGVEGGGRRPFGFRSVPTGRVNRHGNPVHRWQVDDGEAAIIAAYSRRLLQGERLYTLAADLNGHGVPTVTGAAWTPETLRDMLLRPRNAALIVTRDEQGEPVETATDAWQPIISRDMFEVVKATLTAPDRRTGPGPAPKYLGSGIYRCGVCDDGTRCEVTMGGRAPRYRCRGPKNHLSRAQAPLDDYVTSVFKGRLRRADVADLLTRPTAEVDVVGLRAEASAIRKNIAGMAADRALGLIDRAEMLAANKAAKTRLDTIDAQLAAAVVDSPLAPFAGAEDVDAVWDALSLAGRRAALDTVLMITILSGGRGRGFNPDTVRIEAAQGK